jgi:hypothetical protein
MTDRLLALLACVFIGPAVPASGAVTVSLKAAAAQDEARVVELLNAPERTAAQGLVLYRAASWSQRFDVPSRKRVLAALKSRWGEALIIEDDARFGGAWSASPGRAVAVVIPAALLGGQHWQVYDNASLVLTSADAPPIVVAVAAPKKPVAGDHLASSAKPTKKFEDVVVELIDELSVREPALFLRIRAEEARIRALPTRPERVAAVEAAYPRLEASLERSAAQGKLGPKGAANWIAFRAQAKEALAAGTLFEKAQFAGKAFDDRVQRLLNTGKTVLDPNRKLPEKKNEYLRLAQRIHDKLDVRGNSTALTTQQLDDVFRLVGAEFGIRPDFLKYMAKTESGLKQTVPSNPAATGIMQIESVHREAYSGDRNVANDTITNIVFGGLLRAQTDREIAKRFSAVNLTPPSNPRVVEFLGDLAYNRGPGLLKYIAQYAAQQEIDVNIFAEYIAGPGGSYKIVNGGKSITIIPGPRTNIDRTGQNSVLDLASEAVGRVKFSKKLTAGLGDRNGDGRVDHLDVWLTRGIKYLADPNLKSL